MERTTGLERGLGWVELPGSRVDVVHLFRMLAQRVGDGKDNVRRHAGMKSQGRPHGDSSHWL